MDQNEVKVLSDEQILTSTTVVETLKKFNLSQKSTQKQEKGLYNLLNFINKRNKIIILDHYFDTFNDEYKAYVFSTIIPLIQKTNFVVIK